MTDPYQTVVPFLLFCSKLLFSLSVLAFFYRKSLVASNVDVYATKLPLHSLVDYL